MQQHYYRGKIFFQKQCVYNIETENKSIYECGVFSADATVYNSDPIRSI